MKSSFWWKKREIAWAARGQWEDTGSIREQEERGWIKRFKIGEEDRSSHFLRTWVMLVSCPGREGARSLAKLASPRSAWLPTWVILSILFSLVLWLLFSAVLTNTRRHRREFDGSTWTHVTHSTPGVQSCLYFFLMYRLHFIFPLKNITHLR